MPRKKIVRNVKSKCRVCLGDDGCMSHLFDEHLLPRVQDLSKCTDIQIKDDEDLPGSICHVCLYKLNMWGEFKELFVESNKMLLAHLQPQEAMDQFKTQSKRKHMDSQQSGTESPSGRTETKKLRQETLQPLEFASVDCVADQSVLKEMYIPEEDPMTLVDKDNPEKSQEKPATDPQEEDAAIKTEEESMNAEGECEMKPTLVPMKMEYFGPRRGKTTEKRRASTKRWVARKKALQAATGDCQSDTDSVASDNDIQLSPVQKARAKTNADKEVEKQKRLAKALKNLETNMKGQYGIRYDSDSICIPDTDSDGRIHRTRSSQRTNNAENSPPYDSKNLNVSKENTKQSVLDTKEANARDTQNKSGKMEKTTPGKMGRSTNAGKQTDLEHTPQTVRSEIAVGDVSYIITSTLVLAEPHYLKAHINNTSKGGGNELISGIRQDCNTDIIDAVQLRRINPMTNEGEDKKYMERCLNIEVEGTELEALERVQAELAAYVEKDLKSKLFNKQPLAAESLKADNKPKDSFQTLDQQLKTIVEQAIKKNYESSKMRKVPLSKIVTARHTKSRAFTAAFIKAAMCSKLFQPRVLLRRLDLARVGRRYKINNLSILQRRKSKTEEVNSWNILSGKRQSIRPARFCEFDTLALDSDESPSSKEGVVTSTPRVTKPTPHSKPRTSKMNGPLSRKKISSTDNTLSFPQQVIHAIRKGLTDEEHVESMECDTTTLPLESTCRPIGPKKTEAVKSTGGGTKQQGQSHGVKTADAPGKHICSVCKKAFDNLSEAEEHEKTHRGDPSLKKSKNRMMRCKKCHEIVEARFVKLHICKSTKSPHKCYVCNSSFRSEKMLILHLETHDESEFNIESIERGANGKKLSTVTSTQNINAQTQVELKTKNEELLEKEKEKQKEKEKEKAKVPPKDAYTCFVCDKKFTDEEILKDHLQKHCDDISEDEQSTSKEQAYQCAICGQSFDTEEVLESHVEKHLFDDEDDNPNLISISTENDKEEEVFKCQQCLEECPSEMLLAIHMQAHVEEVEIAEWEKEGGMQIDTDFVCPICDDTFESQEDLSKHLDVHNGNAHVCFLCEKPFPTLKDLQMHVATH